MTFAEFSIPEVKSSFGLETDERPNHPLFESSPAIQPSELLKQTLDENVPLALAISTEKARSELIIVPVLLEARRRTATPVSLFSGVEFSVDFATGLNGVCDFLLSLSREQLTVEAPVIAVVEAKNDNLKSGYGHCIAEMVAVRLFNERANKPLNRVFGVVTTGSLWKFLALEKQTVSIDSTEYHISDVDRIVGILSAMLRPQE